jgi:DNA-binding IclR family transcriptional regulator
VRRISRRNRAGGFARARKARAGGSLAEHCSVMGKASMKKRTPEQRSEFGRQAARARWAKHNAQKALERGELPPDDDIVI